MKDDLRKTKLDHNHLHYFEHTNLEQELPWRIWIRKNMPTGPEGFTFEDVDGVASIHGEIARGRSRFMLIEFKLMDTKLDLSQKITYERIDRLLRKADPFRNEYKGFFIVEWPREGISPYVRINYRKLLNADEFHDFLLFQLQLKSYFEE